MAAEPLEIVTPKLSDRELVAKWIDYGKVVGASHVTFRLKNTPICNNLPVENTEEDDQYALLTKFIEIGAKNLGAVMSAAGHSLSYNRGDPFDKITINIPSGQQPDFDKTAMIAGEVGKHFEELDLSASLMALADEDLKRYYKQREAELIRLQQLTEQLINRNDEYRHKVDDEKLAYQKEADKDYWEKVTALNERSAQLDKREEEMELADAKSARRKIRHDILEKLKPEGGLKLAGQALSKTWPIHAIFVAVSISFAAAAYSALSAGSFDLEKWVHIARIGLPSFGLIGTLLWYFRWMDAWLRKNVDEELRFRQLEIDVDRASWVVEVLAELEEETKTPIPDDVLGALTRNLFVGPNKTEEVTHPAQDAIAALLGSARGIDLEFPGGRISTDGRRARKSVEKGERDNR